MKVLVDCLCVCMSVWAVLATGCTIAHDHYAKEEEAERVLPTAPIQRAEYLSCTKYSYFRLVAQKSVR